MATLVTKNGIGARLGAEWHTLSLPIGGIVRFLFFITTGVIGFAALANSHWPVLQQPLSQLTVWMVAVDLAKAIMWAALILTWRLWAFSGDEKNYPAWALVGVTTLLVSIGYAAREITTGARPASIALILLLTIAIGACAERSVALDGYWWGDDRSDSAKTKVLYVVGLLDGVTALGPGIAGDDDLGHRTVYLRSMVGFVGGITVDQVTDGLFAFYEEPRNRPILVSLATWVVIKRLGGAPSDETEAITATLRAAATSSELQ